MNERKKHHSLAHSLTLWFLVFGLIPLIAVSWLGYKEANSRLRESANDELKVTSELSVRFLQSWFHDRLKDLDTQAHSEDNAILLKNLSDGYYKNKSVLTDYVLSSEWKDNLTDAHDDLLALKNRYDYIYDLFLIDREGNMLYSVAQEDDLGTNILTGKYSDTLFAKAVRMTLETGKVSFSGLEFYQPTKQAAGFISAPVFDKQGNNIGIFTIQLKVEEVLDLLNFNDQKLTSLSFYLVDQNGLLLSAMKGGNLDDPLKRIINTEPIKHFEEATDEYLEQHNLKTSNLEYIGPNGRKVLGISHVVELVDVSWVLISEIDRDEAMVSSDWLGRMLLTMLIFSIVTLIVVAFYLARQITQPIISLANASKRAAAGEIDQHVTIHSDDEIGQLTQAFNHMLYARKEYEQVLEQRTQEVQQTLFALNEQKFALDQHATVSISDIGGAINFVNDKFSEISGYSREELLGKNHRILNSKFHSKSFFVEMYETITNGEVWNGEIRNRSKHGKIFWLNTTIVPFLGEDGKPKSYIAIRSDITLLKETEAALIAAKVEAEKAVLIKDEFLASMSHEIRTPMNGVLGMLGLLLNTDLSDEQHYQAILAQRSGQSLLNLINDILDLSKVAAGKLDLEFIDFELNKSISELVEAMAYEAQRKGLELVLDLSGVDQTMVKGDPSRIRQILTNLISNAIKFTQEGEILICVTLEESDHDHWRLVCRVSDTGIGIPAGKVGVLFKSFQQVDTSTTREFGGTGLGLSIVKKLCLLMDGGVKVESELGKGSQFEMNIKLQKSNDSATPPRPIDIEKLSFLIVDKNLSNRQTLCRQLETWDATAVAVGNGYQALDLCEEQLQQANKPFFDYIIINEQLADMTGSELGQAITANRYSGDIKLLMMTSLTSSEDMDYFSENGFRDCFPKPVTTTSLLNILNPEGYQQKQVKNYGKIEDIWLKSTSLEWTENTRVLLVEDNKVNQVVATGVLSQFGLEADIASNGLEALECLSSKNQYYDLILMDCEMPEMDGYEASQEIRSGAAGEKYKLIPIIAMTANVMLGIRDKCKASGMSDYLEKPIDPEALLGKLKDWMPVESQASKIHLDMSITASNEMSETSQNIKVSEHLIWDKEAILRRVMGDKELLIDVLDVFTSEVPTRLEDIQQSIDGKDYDRTRLLVHSFKGVASNVSALHLQKLAAVMEQTAKIADHVQLIEQIADIRQVCQQLLEEMSLYKAEQIENSSI